jgi:hypothetical protein
MFFQAAAQTIHLTLIVFTGTVIAVHLPTGMFFNWITSFSQTLLPY